jgi:structural phage protein|nr:MAG TPA: hypothetical protein [Caudoviricetes sp.]
MLNREHSQITYEDLRRFLEHIRLEYRRYVIDKTSEHSKSIIDIGYDNRRISIGDVITVHEKKYVLASIDKVTNASPLLVVLSRVEETKLEVLSYGVIPVRMNNLKRDSIVYLGEDGKLTNEKPVKSPKYLMGIYSDSLLLIYPRQLSTLEEIDPEKLRKLLQIDKVDNTSDLDKPISNATAAEFNRVMNTIRTLHEALKRQLEDHINDNERHITAAERLKWDDIGDKLKEHVENESIHMTNAERQKWNDMTPMEKFLAHINNKTIHPAIGGYDQLDLRYAKKSDIPTVPTKVSAFENDAKYITKDDIPALDLTNYVKKADLDTKLSEYPKKGDLSDYLKKSDIDAKLANYQTKLYLPDFIKRSDVLPPYENTTEIYISHTHMELILVDFDDKNKMFTALRAYSDPSSYYFGINAAAEFQIFQAFYMKAQPNIFNIYDWAADVPMNSITVIRKSLTETGVKEGMFGILLRNKNGKHFIYNNKTTIVSPTPPTPTPTPTPSVGIATETKAGIVRPDNTTITVDSNGIITAHTTHTMATTDKIGSVKPDDDTIGIKPNGALYVKRQGSNKLVQLTDVDSTDLNKKGGFALFVKDDASGFEFRKPGNAFNRHFEKTVHANDYQLVYDFTQHINTAISASVDIGNISTEKPVQVKFIGKNGGEIVETIFKSYYMTIPEREFYVSMYILGHAKVSIDILSLA